MSQEWRSVSGYDGLYEVSNTGNVRNVRSGRILKPCQHRLGYMSVLLYKGKSTKRKLVHRLVAESFLDKPTGCTCVNHKDEDKQNNCLDNLEWCTAEYNMNYGTISSRIAKKRGSSARKKRPVCQIDATGAVVRIWDSIAMAARETNTQKTSIFDCCNGVHKSANCYAWKYADERIS